MSKMSAMIVSQDIFICKHVYFSLFLILLQSCRKHYKNSFEEIRKFYCQKLCTIINNLMSSWNTKFPQRDTILIQKVNEFLRNPDNHFGD